MTLTYAVITPIRDERAHLPRLAAALVRQEQLPARWVLVDNGSSDGSLELAHELADAHHWIEVTRSEADVGSRRGAPVVRAVHAGLHALGECGDVVVKLDADVSVAPDYFSVLLDSFERNPRLGMASGACWDRDGDRLIQRHVTGTNVWGAARAYRRLCLDDVLPLEERMGWDGIDVVRARVAGWETTTIVDLPFEHHRLEGLRDGARTKAWRVQGNVAHYMGYRPSYVLFRALFRSLREPAAMAILGGYLQAAFSRDLACEDEAVRNYVRSQQRFRRLPERLAEAIGRRPGGGRLAGGS